MVRFEGLEERHRMAIIDIFNYYVDKTTYAYPDGHVGYGMFDSFLDNARQLCGYAILDGSDAVIGFCQLRPYKPMATFDKTVEITYFLSIENTGRGIGKHVLDRLVEDARRLGKTRILASISGENATSIRFHEKNGFVACGRFKGVGHKLGRDFDIVYMQRDI